MKVSLMCFTTAVFFFVVGCNSRDLDIVGSDDDALPKLAGIIANPITVAPGGISNITLNIVDGDVDTLGISYSASGGTISGNGAEAIFMADTTEGVGLVTVTVSGSNGQITSGSASINIIANPPLISVAAQTLDETLTDNQCLVFTGFPTEDLILLAVSLENPAGQSFTLTGELVQSIDGIALVARTAFALQTVGRCYTLFTGSYTFSFTLQRTSNDASFEAQATYQQL